MLVDPLHEATTIITNCVDQNPHIYKIDGEVLPEIKSLLDHMHDVIRFLHASPAHQYHTQIKRRAASWSRK